MDYILVACRKFKTSDSGILDSLVAPLGAEISDDVVYSFGSDRDFDSLLSDVDDSLDSQFYYSLVLCDGTQDDPIPKCFESNCYYINSFCRGRLSNKTQSGDLHSLLTTSILRSQRLENLLNKK
jgi:hypothetical protein